MSEDEKLIADYLAGDEAALEKLIEKYRRMVYSLTWRMLGTAELAEEATQSVFVKLFKNIGKFKGKSSFKTWLYAIALNESRGYRRKLSREPAQAEEVDIPDLSSNPERDLSREEERDLLRGALARLSFKQRSVVTLRINDELPFAQIAEALGMSVNSAKVNYQHGFKRLQEILTGGEE